MFSLVSGIYETYFAPVQLNILIIGPPGCGKTSILERLKVTQTSNNISQSQILKIQKQTPQLLPKLNNERLKEDAQKKQQQQQQQSQQQQQQQPQVPQTPQNQKQTNRFWSCPASKRYHQHEEEDNDEVIVQLLPSPQQDQQEQQQAEPQQQRQQQNDDDTPHETQPTQQQPSPQQQQQQYPEPKQEFDLKPKAKMLPLKKIRPTIGMNLGKLELCGAICNVWDVGGKMESLWERYYRDCDAVIFVWKISSQENSKNNSDSENDDNDSDDDDDDKDEEYDYNKMKNLLEQVRKNIPDDIPFLVLGHVFCPNNTNTATTSAAPPSATTTTTTTTTKTQQQQPERNNFFINNDDIDYSLLYNTRYSTSSLIPHYHNPIMCFFFCDASTGAGIRSAMEWFIPISKIEHNIRLRNNREIISTTK